MLMIEDPAHVNTAWARPATPVSGPVEVGMTRFVAEPEHHADVHGGNAS
jgi:hypothetical protein